VHAAALITGRLIVTSPKRLARIAGLLYLIVALLGGFAISVNYAIAESGNAAATADSIRASAPLFRLSLVSNLVAGTFWLLTAMALYLLLRHVHELAAAAMVIFVAVSAAGNVPNLLNQYTALAIATGDAYIPTFGKAGADALTLLFVEMQTNGTTLGAMLIGLWLVPLGYLVIRSGYFPKPLGVLLIIGCFGYLAAAFTGLLAPDADAAADTLFLIGGLPEFVFVAWLLAKGVRVPVGAAPVRPVAIDKRH
jgi:Domain of unknown function (DUF4386)